MQSSDDGMMSLRALPSGSSGFKLKKASVQIMDYWSHCAAPLELSRQWHVENVCYLPGAKWQPVNTPRLIHRLGAPFVCRKLSSTPTD